MSLATASRALGQHESVSDDIRLRVRAVADSIGYVANMSAQALRSKRNAVAVIVDDITTASVAAMVTAMQTAGRADGTLVLVSGTSAIAQRTLHALRVFRGLNPRAIVMVSGGVDAEADLREIGLELADYAAGGGRVVVLEPTPWLQFPSVGLSQEALARTLTNHMTSLGRRRAIVLAGSANHVAFAARARTFVRELEDSGISPEHISVLHSSNDRAGAESAVRSAIATQAEPTMILAASDALAIGAMRALRDLGIEVPRQIAVGGIDDSPMSQDVFPGLTTVRQPFDSIGREALRLAVSADVTEATHIELRGELVVRASA